MKKLILGLVISAFYVATASAEYIIKIPLEKANGGSLPNGSIVFNSKSTVEPSLPNEGNEEEPAEQEEAPIPAGLEGYQNINGVMQCSTYYNPNGQDSSCVADETVVKINSQKNDIKQVIVNAGWSGCGIGPCTPTFSVGVSITVKAAVQDIVDKATVMTFTDSNNSIIECPITSKYTYMSMNSITFADEMNTSVSCKLSNYVMPSTGNINYSVSIR